MGKNKCVAYVLSEQVMVEAVCNHTPEVIVIDEISNIEVSPLLVLHWCHRCTTDAHTPTYAHIHTYIHEHA